MTATDAVDPDGRGLLPVSFLSTSIAGRRRPKANVATPLAEKCPFFPEKATVLASFEAKEEKCLLESQRKGTALVLHFVSYHGITWRFQCLKEKQQPREMMSSDNCHHEIETGKIQISEDAASNTQSDPKLCDVGWERHGRQSAKSLSYLIAQGVVVRIIESS